MSTSLATQPSQEHVTSGGDLRLFRSLEALSSYSVADCWPLAGVTDCECRLRRPGEFSLRQCATKGISFLENAPYELQLPLVSLYRRSTVALSMFAFVRLFNMPKAAEYGHVETGPIRCHGGVKGRIGMLERPNAQEPWRERDFHWNREASRRTMIIRSSANGESRPSGIN